jgi:hypothetical protein
MKRHKEVLKSWIKGFFYYWLDPGGPRRTCRSVTLFGFIYRETFYFLILRINFLKEFSVLLAKLESLSVDTTPNFEICEK